MGRKQIQQRETGQSAIVKKETLERLIELEEPDWDIVLQAARSLKIFMPECRSAQAYESLLTKISEVLYCGPKTTQDGYDVIVPYRNGLGQIIDATTADCVCAESFSVLFREMHFCKTQDTSNNDNEDNEVQD